MLTAAAYLDDSGTHQGSPVVCLGGFVAKVERWKRLAQSWRRALDASGIPYTRMSAMENFKAPFDKWTPYKKAETVERFQDIIGQHLSAPIVAPVYMAAYDSIVATDEARTVVGSPLELSLKGALINVKDWADEVGHDGPVDFVIDEGVDGKGPLASLFERLHRDEKKAKEYRVGRLTFDSVHNLPQLQAADMHAYEAYKVVRDQKLDVDGKKREIRKATRGLLSRFGQEATYSKGFDADGIRAYLKGPREGWP